MTKLTDIIGERLFYGYESSLRWRDSYIKSVKFFFGEHLSTEDKNDLLLNGKEIFISNQIRPLTKQLKAILTANKPTFGAASVAADDRKVRDQTNQMFKYTYRISKGYIQLSRIIRNAILGGLGLAYVYFDPDKSKGLGDVVFKSVSPLKFIGDWKSKEIDFSDMRFQIYFDYVPLNLAKRLFGISDKEAEEYLTQDDLNTINIVNDEEEHIVFGDTLPSERVETLIGVGEYYYYEYFDAYKVTNMITGESITIDSEDIVYPLPRFLDVQKVETRKVVKVTFIADSIKASKVKVLGKEILDNVNRLPFVPFILEDTENPYPTGEVYFMTGYQRWINRYYQIILEHGSNAARHFLGISKEEDVEDIEDRMRSGNGVIGFENPENVREFKVPPLDQIILLAKNDIEMKMKEMIGIYDSLLGNPNAATGNYSETLVIQEKGMQRAKETLRNFEVFLESLGSTVFQFYRQYYDYPRVLTFYDEDEQKNVMIHLNSRLAPDSIFTKDLNTDLVIVPASYMPTNEVAQGAMLKELLPFANEVERSLIFRKILESVGISYKNLEELEAKTDMIMQLQQQLQTMSELIKQQEGEIQRLKNMLFTADRRSVKAEFEAHLEKKYQRAARDIDIAEEQLKANKIEGESNGKTE